MRDYLEPMLGTNGALVAQFAITLVVLAVIILIVFWLIRTFTRGGGTTQIRGRQPRLSVLDALPVDQRRRLVLIRRDNVEHLILIGGPTDLVVEASIHRPSAAQRRAEAAARGTGQAPRFQPAPAPSERVAFEDERAEEIQLPEPQRPEPVMQEPPRQEPPRQEIARQEIARQERLSRQEPARHEPPRHEPPRHEAVRQEPQYEEPVVEALPEPLPVEAIDIEPPQPEPQPAIQAPPPPPKPARPISSFLGSVGRGRSAPSETQAEGSTEPRRPEPPQRPLGRATPRAPEPPVADEIIDVAPRVEPVRPAPRAPMPPAPPVAPPTLGDEPYGAPTADADRQIRFEPIFDIDPTDATDPGRPTRQSRDPVAAPSVEPPRLADQPGTIDDAAPDEADPRTRTAAVGDLEKEMARLLGEISGTRRN